MAEDFIIQHKEPDKKHAPNPENQIEIDAEQMQEDCNTEYNKRK